MSSAFGNRATLQSPSTKEPQNQHCPLTTSGCQLIRSTSSASNKTPVSVSVSRSMRGCPSLRRRLLLSVCNLRMNLLSSWRRWRDVKVEISRPSPICFLPASHPTSSIPSLRAPVEWITNMRSCWCASAFYWMAHIEERSIWIELFTSRSCIRGLDCLARCSGSFAVEISTTSAHERRLRTTKCISKSFLSHKLLSPHSAKRKMGPFLLSPADGAAYDCRPCVLLCC